MKLPKKTSPIVLGLLFLSIQVHQIIWAAAESSTMRPDDAVWISVLGDRFLDVQHDGQIFMVKGFPNRAALEVRAGPIPDALIQRAFRILTSPAIVNARDTEPGEEIFSDSFWVSVGMVIKGTVTFSQPWGYTEELKDYPAEFQQLLVELTASAENLPIASEIKAIIVADGVDPERRRSIQDDPRKFYAFVELDDAALRQIPTLERAIGMPHRLLPVKDDSELDRIVAYFGESNPQSVGRSLFLTVNGQSYQIEFYPL